MLFSAVMGENGRVKQRREFFVIDWLNDCAGLRPFRPFLPSNKLKIVIITKQFLNKKK